MHYLFYYYFICYNLSTIFNFICVFYFDCGTFFFRFWFVFGIDYLFFLKGNQKSYHFEKKWQFKTFLRKYSYKFNKSWILNKNDTSLLITNANLRYKLVLKHLLSYKFHFVNPWWSILITIILHLIHSLNSIKYKQTSFNLHNVRQRTVAIFPFN